MFGEKFWRFEKKAAVEFRSPFSVNFRCDSWCPMQSQDLYSMILMGSLQLTVLYGSMKMKYLIILKKI